MKCNRIKKTLAAYLDDELTARRKEQVENHLKYCVFCRIELGAFRKSSKLLDGWSDIQPRKDIAGEVMLQIQKSRQDASVWERAWQFFDARKYQVAKAAALVLILAAIVTSVNLPQRQGARPGLADMDGTVKRAPVVQPLRPLIQPSKEIPMPEDHELFKMYNQYYGTAAGKSSELRVRSFYDNKNRSMHLIVYPVSR